MKTYKYRRNNRVRNHHGMLNIVVWNFDEEHDMYIVSKYFFTRYLLNTEEDLLYCGKT